MSKRRQIVIVCPTLLDRDAVGAAAAALYQDISAEPGWRVTVLTRRNDRQDTPAEMVAGLGDLLLHPDFLQAELIIYIYAIYSDLFDALLVGNGRAKQVVRFHNVTPRAFVEEKDREIIDRSMDQLRNFDVADEIWADSEENVTALHTRKIAVGSAQVIPLSVRPPVRQSLARKSTGKINLLYVGRIVRSKGLEDLVGALQLFRSSSPMSFRAKLVGNLDLAQQGYVTFLRDQIADAGLTDQVSLIGPVSGEELSAAYFQAHVLLSASHHEGFCVPVIEGLAAGCIPVTYANSNLRHISGGLGRLASSESPPALAEALGEIAVALKRYWDSEAFVLPLERGPTSIAEFDRRARLHVARFSATTCAKRTRQRVEVLLSGPREADLTGGMATLPENIVA